jgi:hypothetical protein
VRRISHVTAKPDHRGRSAVQQVPANGSRNVSPISMFCGLPISVARGSDVRRAREREQKRDVVRSASARRPRPSIGVIARQTMSLASTDESAPAATMTQSSRVSVRAECRRDPPHDLGVEAAQTELGRDHHEAEEQRQRVRVRGEHRFVERQSSRREDRDGAEQRDAAAIERQPGISPRIMPM